MNWLDRLGIKELSHRIAYSMTRKQTGALPKVQPQHAQDLLLKGLKVCPIAPFSLDDKAWYFYTKGYPLG